MLYISLALSVALLILVNRSVRWSQKPVRNSLVYTSAFAVLPALVFTFPPLFLQSVLMSFLLALLLVPGRGKRLYLPVSCVITLVAYVFVMRPAFEKQQEYARLRQEYPFESIEDRLPDRTAGIESQPVQTEQLDRIERSIDETTRSFFSRTAQLRHLHERSVNEFIDSAGFGVSRRIRMTTNAHSITRDLHEDQPIPQPDYLDPQVPPVSGLSNEVSNWNSKSIGDFHVTSVLDFLNPGGFGYFKNRREVAGFQSHSMSAVHEVPKPWKVARIDLVGFLIHKSPVVYRSSSLPRMSDARNAPTRPLDVFESDGLESLKQGEDLFVRGANDQARMLGAIRVTKQCLECHGGKRGDLLGAFSYSFRREAK